MNDKKKNIPMDISNYDFEKGERESIDLPGLVEYAHSRGGFSVIPTEQGHIKGKAIEAMKGQTQMQLDNLFEQMKLLAKQVKDIQNRVDVSEMIYKAQMKFEPVIGQSYYLYLMKNQKYHLSLISPDEWGKSSPYEFISKVELLADHTWKVEKKIK